MEHSSFQSCLALFWVHHTTQQQQEKTVLIVNYGIFGAFLNVLSLKEHLNCNLVHFFTFTHFPFLRDWSHVEVTFCAGYHKPV